MVGRFSAIIGPVCWGLVTDYLHLGRPAAVASLLIFVVAGWWLLLPVTDERRTWPRSES
jgi:MFS-type transporter involved in bile tolerance (Atg22 family)